MALNSSIKGWLSAVCAAALFAVSAAIAPTASAEDAHFQSSTGTGQSVDLAAAPEVAPAARPAGLTINRPTIPMADYIAAKNAAAAQAPGQRKPGAAAPPVSSGVTLFAQVGSTNETQTTGGNQLPPGGDLATSATWMVQVNTDIITTLNWFTNAFAQIKLSTFFQDGTNFIFDPRVIYDPYWDRFVVLADACANCGNATSNVSAFKLAISKTGDPTGAWWIYTFNPGVGVGDFADFPQLGMDLNSIIITYNDFLANGSFAANVLTFAKALTYNGRGTRVAVLGYSGCSIAPPYVLDDSGVDYLMSFCPGQSIVYIASLTNSGLSNAYLHTWDNTVAVTHYGIPPQAVQPAAAGGYTLDTGDNRFENRSLQVGSRIINTATINDVGYSAPAWYNFNIYASPHTLVTQGLLDASLTSYDWHPAINANTVGAPSGAPLGEVFVTWMSTDPNPYNNVNVQLRAAGWTGDTPGSSLSGIPVYTSAIPLTNQTDSQGIHRTGDYAYIATYPAPALGCDAGELGILTGETAGPAAGTWGTHVAIVKHC
jgi:hypothetical protein